MEHEHEESHKITAENEHKTLIVIIFTLVTMVAEVVYGYMTNSMGLLADGYHMACHAMALSLTYIAYVLIRKLRNSPRFPSGTNKIGILAAYTSSLILGATGIWIIFEALNRFLNPVQIQFNTAILVAIIGLIVNGICILIMENPFKRHETQDYNFKSAYYHILADALTSVLAIIALYIGKYFNFIILDAIVGILGGILILKWAASLLKKTVTILIDMKN